MAEHAETVEKAGFCCLCRSRCGAVFEVSGGRLIKAKPAPDHPTGKALCVKGKAAPEIAHSPERMLHPMRRTTPKTDPDPGWERVSWEEAMRDIAARLGAIREASGAEAVGFGVTTPSGTPISDSIEWIERFIRLFGSPNTVYGTEICNWHKDHAHRFTYGSGILYPDHANADAILLWGFNPSAVWLDQATQIAAARGARIVAVDPRRTGYARRADPWLRVRPGTDGALAMGLAHILIEREAFDAAFIRRWSNGTLLVRTDTGRFLREAEVRGRDGATRLVARRGNGALVFYDPETRCFDADPDTDTDGLALRGTVRIDLAGAGPVACRPAFDLFAEACATYEPAVVAARTSVPEADLMAAAETLIAARRVAYYCWSGVGQHRDATQTDRAIALLMALKGGYDSPGGNVAFTKHPLNPATDFTQFPEGQIEKALGYAERPLGPPSQGWVRAAEIYRAILEGSPYPIRAMVVFGANMAVSQGDTDRAVEAFRALDFHVHCDSVETPTARFADYFLPVNTPWEREALRNGFEVTQEAESLIQLRQPMIPPAGESRSDTEIVFDLATRLGMGQAFFGGDIDKARAWQLEPVGLSLADLRARPEGIRRDLAYRPRKYAESRGEGVTGFATPTGLVEIYSQRLRDHGHAPMPAFPAPADSEAAAYPLLLTTAKSPYYCHSQQRHIASLRRRKPTPTVTLHPDTAEAEGLAPGDRAWVETAHGRIRLAVETDGTLDPGVAVADYGWWQGNEALGLPAHDPFSEEGANYNRLISAGAADPISGSVPHRSTRARVSAERGDGE
ncbi:molybdopterin-dependent oxidoreductase [Marivibrio halodurans]|uniref:Molybdopterin-dependent oxidoreductase n=1 Tax=Marivibrio halodurans TaxID=2039722 RepID=A0A8J7S6W7_9PROT|nr:molybdopterin-dependent oxidoreductase [Marivibrio halodurans]MBP5856687.1 molybdopterin-dependent oxidoreductase [Marivibrio halodurans]